MKRIVSVETSGGVVLDIYSLSTAFRAEIRDAEENIIFATAAANLDGDRSALESISNFFLMRGDELTGKLLVEHARAEIEMSGVEARATVPGYLVAEAIYEAFVHLTDAYPIAIETITALSARAAVDLALRFDVRERP